MSVHLLVGLPFCDRLVMPEWAVALRQLVVPMNSTFGFVPIRGLPIDEARNLLAKTAIEHQSKYLFFIDDDTAPPQNALTRLIATLDSKPEAMVAAGIYFSREKSPQPLVFKQEGGGPSWDWAYGEVFECSSIATGCMLVKTEIFKKLEEPWFKTDPSQNLTDDIYFCRKVREAGFKIFADGGVIPIHWDANARKSYVMSQTDPPVVRYKEQLANLPVPTELEFRPV